jgi:chromosome segregation ATPase
MASPKSASSRASVRHQVQIEIVEPSQGRVKVKWGEHEVARLKLSWQPAGAQAAMVNLDHIDADGLQNLASQVYSMYKAQFDAIAKDNPSVTLGHVAIGVNEDRVSSFTGAHTDFHQAQEVYNLVMNRGGMSAFSPAGSASSSRTMRSLSGRLSPSDGVHGTPLGESASAITDLSSPVISDSGELRSAQRRLAALEEELREARADLWLETQAHGKTKRKAGYFEGRFQQLELELREALSEKEAALKRLDASQQENTALWGTLATIQADLAAAKTLLGQHEDTIVSLRADLATAQGKVDRLTPLVATLQERTAALTQNKTALEVRIATLEAEGRDQAASVGQLKETLAGVRTDLAFVAAQLVTSQTELGEARREVAAKDRFIAEKNTAIARLEAEKVAQQVQLARNEEIITTLRATVDEKQALINSGVGDRERLTRERDAARASLAAAETELAVRASRIQTQQQDIARLTGEIAARDARLQAQERRIEGLSGQIEGKSRQISDLRRRLEGQLTELKALRAHGRHKDKGEIARLQRDLAVMVTLLEGKERELTRVQEAHAVEVTGFRRQIESLSREKDAAQVAHRSALERLEAQSEQLRVKDASIAKLGACLEILKARLAEAESSAAASAQAADSQEDVIEALRQQLLDVSRQAAELTGHNQAMGHALMDARSMVGYIQTQLAASQMTNFQQALAIRQFIDLLGTKDRECGDLLEALRGAQGDLAAAQSQLRELRSHAGASEEARLAADQELAASAARVAALESKLADAGRSIAALESEIASTRQERDEARQALRSQGDQIKALRKNNGRLLKQLRRKKANLERVNAILREQQVRLLALARVDRAIGGEADGAASHGSPRAGDDPLAEIKAVQEALARNLQRLREEKAELERDIEAVIVKARGILGEGLAGGDGSTILGRRLDAHVAGLISQLEAKEVALSEAAERNERLQVFLEEAQEQRGAAVQEAQEYLTRVQALEATLQALSSGINGLMGAEASSDVLESAQSAQALIDGLRRHFESRLSEIKADIAQKIEQAVEEEAKRAAELRKPLEIQIARLEGLVASQAAELSSQADRLKKLEAEDRTNAAKLELFGRLKAELKAALEGEGRTFEDDPSADELAKAVREVLAAKKEQIKSLERSLVEVRAAQTALETGELKELRAALGQVKSVAGQAVKRAETAESKLEAILTIVGGDDPVEGVRQLKDERGQALERIEGQARALAELHEELSSIRKAQEALKAFHGEVEGALGGTGDLLARAREAVAAKTTLEAQLQALNKHLATLLSREGEAAHDSPEDMLETLSGLLARQKEGLAAQAAEILDLQSRLATAGREKDEALVELTSLKRTSEAQATQLNRLSEVEAELRQARQAAEAAQEALEAEKRQVSGREDQIAALKAQLAREHEALRAFALSIGLSVDDSIGIDQVLRNIQSKVPAAKELEAALSAQALLKTAEAEKEAALERIGNLVLELRGLRAQFIELQARFEAFQRGADEKLSTLATSLERAEAALKAVTVQAQALKEENSRLRSSKEATAADLVASGLAIEGHNRLIKELISKYAPEDRVTATTTEGLLGHLSGVIEAHARKIESLESQLASALSGQSAAEARETDLNEKYERLEAQLRSLGSSDGAPSATPASDDPLIAAVRAQLDGLRQQMALAAEESRTTAAELQRQLKACEEAVTAAALENTGLNRRLEALRHELAEASKRSDLSEAENQRLRQLVGHLLTTSGLLEGTEAAGVAAMGIRDLQALVQDKAEGWSALAQQLTSAKTALEAELEASGLKIAAQGERLGKAESEIEALKAENRRLSSEVSSLTSKNAELEKQVREQAATIVGLELRLTEKGEALATALQEKEAANRNYAEALKQIAALDARVKSAVDAFEALRKEDAALLEAKTRELKELEAQLAALKRGRTQLEQAAARADKRYERLRAAICGDDSTADPLERLSALSGGLGKLERDNQALAEQVHRLDAAESELRKQLERSEAERSRISASLAEAMSELSSTGTGDTSSLADRIGQLKRQLGQKGVECEGLRSNLKEAQDKNQELIILLKRVQENLEAQETAIQSMQRILETKNSEAAGLKGRVIQYETDFQRLQERISTLESGLKASELAEKAAKATAAATRVMNVTLRVDPSRDLGIDALAREMAAFSATVTRMPEVPTGTVAPVDMASQWEALIRAIPKAIATGSLEALMSDEVAADIGLYEQVLERLLSFEGDKSELLLNLMLVVANHRGALSPAAQRFLETHAKAKGDSVRSNQIQALLLSGRPGYLNATTPIPINPNIQKYALAQLTRFDALLDDETSVMDDDTRSRLKTILATTILKPYLLKLGFLVSDEGVAQLAQYVRTHKGRLPPALNKYLAAGDRSEKQFLHILSKMLYDYNACDSECRGRFFNIASCNNLDWLTDGQSSDQAADTMLKFIARSPPHLAFTHLQAVLWGPQVAALRLGETPMPIHGAGGSGKTATVLHFLKFLEDVNPDPASPSIFVSPFAHPSERGSSVCHLMLPAPTTSATGESVFNLDVGDMTLVQMRNARVVIDECHLIRPGSKVMLRNRFGESFEIAEGEYLQLTASPLSAGYDVEAALRTTMDAVDTEIDHLRRLAVGDVAQARKQQTAIEAFNLFIKSNRGEIDEALKYPANPTIGGYLQDSIQYILEGNRSEAMTQIMNFIGGALKKGTGNGILGNTTTRPKLSPALARELEYLAIKVYEALPEEQKKAFLPFDSMTGMYDVEAYRTHTTQFVRSTAASVILIPLNVDQIAAERSRDAEVEALVLKSSEFALHDNVNRSIQALAIERKRLATALDAHKADARLSTYRMTKERRTQALLNMRVAATAPLSLQAGACHSLLNSVLARSSEARTQMILPGIRLDSQAKVESLVRALKPTEDQKVRAFIYHDSIAGSPTYGQDLCIKVGPEGILETMSLSDYENALKIVVSREPVLGEADFAPDTFPDQIVMLYDDTNKQGGDYGIFSQVAQETVTRYPRAQIAQHIFLNIHEEGASAAPAQRLSSGDMYQAQCRRRGTSTDPAPIIYTPELSAIREADLEILPIELLEEQIQAFARSQSDRTRQELLLALLATAGGDQNALVELWKAERIPLSAEMAPVFNLIASCERQQQMIESYLQTAEAAQRIFTEVMGVKRSIQSAASEDVADRLVGDLARVTRGLSSKNRSEFGAIAEILPRIEDVLVSWQAALRPSGEGEEVVVSSPSAAARSPARATTPGSLAGTAASRTPRSTKAPITTGTAARGALHTTVTARVIRAKTEGEIEQYRLITEALNRLKMIHEYAMQASSS